MTELGFKLDEIKRELLSRFDAFAAHSIKIEKDYPDLNSQYRVVDLTSHFLEDYYEDIRAEIEAFHE